MNIIDEIDNELEKLRSKRDPMRYLIFTIKPVTGNEKEINNVKNTINSIIFFILLSPNINIC